MGSFWALFELFLDRLFVKVDRKVDQKVDQKLDQKLFKNELSIIELFYIVHLTS
jgi:hypothetical protein